MSLGNCAIDGKEASVVYPLLPGKPAFCSEHHNARDAGPFGADFSGPDDFDIPDLWDDIDPILAFTPPYDQETGVWTDRGGNQRLLSALDDPHLLNIRRWIVQRASEFSKTRNVNETLKAVDTEITRRGYEIPRRAL